MSWLLPALTVVLAAAFVLAPPLLAASPGTAFTSEPALAAAVRQAVGEYWLSGTPDLPPALAGLAGYLQRYHLVNAVTAGLLVVTLTALVVRAKRRPWLALPAAVPALFAVALVMANVQGAVAPLASLLPMVAGSGPLEPVRADLAGSLASGATPAPAVAVLVDDFALYHAAMVVIATVVAVALAAVSVVLWRRARRGWAILPAVPALLAAVLALANATVAAAPAPALLAFLDGGW
ncbi:hypothetical protein [Actinoplanes philippinensis]|uniref:hypothetical protein n=1 Tax=Actinoplanes philippinensis TaxID=35752 RepID=UPI0033C1E059